jgi:hypothetical protein
VKKEYLRAVDDPTSVVLGFGAITMAKHRDGASLGISFSRGDERLFTIWFANSKGADALAHNALTAKRILERAEKGDPEPEMEWRLITEPKDPRP